MFNQKFTQLILERNHLVMFLLPFDVFNHRVLVAVRNRESTVTLLPMIEARENVVLFNPTAGADFDVFYQSGQRNGGMDFGQNVKVIFHAADSVQMAIFVFQNAPDVAEQVVASVGEQCTFTILRREDDVVVNLGERGHGGSGSSRGAAIVACCENVNALNAVCVSSPKANHMNSRGCNPRNMSTTIKGPERAGPRGD